MTPTGLSQKQTMLLAAILVVSLTLATSNLLIQQATAPESYEVDMLDLSFNPQVLCIEKGDTVVWNNTDALIYTIWFVHAENQSTYLLSDPIPPDQTWSHTFTEPVKLHYYSFGRLWITGKLRVFTIFGDSDIDGDVDVYDLFDLGKAYDSTPTDPNWNPDCDFNWNDLIDEPDLADLSENYGKTDP